MAGVGAGRGRHRAGRPARPDDGAARRRPRPPGDRAGGRPRDGHGLPRRGGRRATTSGRPWAATSRAPPSVAWSAGCSPPSPRRDDVALGAGGRGGSWRWSSRSSSSAPRPVAPVPAPAAAALRDTVRHLAGHLRDPVLVMLYASAFLLMGCFVGVYNLLGFRLLAAPFGLSPPLVGLVFLHLPLGHVLVRASPVGWPTGSARRRVLLGCEVVCLAGLAGHRGRPARGGAGGDAGLHRRVLRRAPGGERLGERPRHVAPGRGQLPLRARLLPRLLGPRWRSPVSRMPRRPGRGSRCSAGGWSSSPWRGASSPGGCPRVRRRQTRGGGPRA